MRSIKTANTELGANFNIDGFWPHVYYEPSSKTIYGVLVSRENQSATIDGNKFSFKTGESIEVMKLRRFTEEDALR